MFKGRYLNGEADLKASLKDGVLIVTLDSIEVNGKKPPDEIMNEMRKQNLAKDAYKDAKNAEMIRKLESLEVKDGKIILKVRAKTARSPAPRAAKKELPVEVVAPAEERTSQRPRRRTAEKRRSSKVERPNPAAAGSPTPKT